MKNFNKRITIETPSIDSVNTFGEPVTSSWSVFYKTGANIKLKTSQNMEAISYSRETNMENYTFELRMSAKSMQITDNHRISLTDGTLFDIVSADKLTLKHKRIILISAIRRL